LHIWTPREVKEQWEILKEARREAITSWIASIVIKVKSSPKKNAKYWKARGGALGEELQVDEKGKKMKVTK